jgi:hypothetical protein
MFIEFIPSLHPIFFGIEVFQDFLSVFRLVPQIGILCLKLELGYAQLSFFVVKDTSSTHQGAERALR